MVETTAGLRAAVAQSKCLFDQSLRARLCSVQTQEGESNVNFVSAAGLMRRGIWHSGSWLVKSDREKKRATDTAMYSEREDLHACCFFARVAADANMWMHCALATICRFLFQASSARAGLRSRKFGSHAHMPPENPGFTRCAITEFIDKSLNAAMARQAKIEKISKLVFDYCMAPDLERVKTTGSITPTTSLRHRSTRHCLRFAKSLGEGRFFTEALTRDVLSHLLENFAVVLPATPGFSTDKWVREEARNLHKLLKRARKSTAMDDQETQMWSCMDAPDLDPTEDL